MTWCFQIQFSLPKGQLSYVEKWPLMKSNEMAFLLAIYLAFILKIGPMVMEHFNAIQMRTILTVYNAIKVANSTMLTFQFLRYIQERGLFPRNCEYDDDILYTIAALYWKYMVTKVLDLFDTVFFVLRKKYSQITFLHVYHHVFMVMITWSSLKYDPSDHWAFMAVLNCTIHVFMYVYYGIASFGLKYRKYLWWKKYLTIMQLIQFLLIMIHVMIQTHITDCPMHAGTYWLGLSNIVLFIFLFMDFYNKKYRTGTPVDNLKIVCGKHQ
ncbi:elongation of very long chain fatty acids protein 7 isoform X1 [Bombyx mori]|uniref:Elongation of very long chain fatty acids protein n=2 Tax=Bombyx mori TaxID=7091 RepID=A0A8R2AIP3_BOMMO|nr:elongation of very long chain fatty acids protein isoform X1 [Bombyx mori]